MWDLNWLMLTPTYPQVSTPNKLVTFLLWKGDRTLFESGLVPPHYQHQIPIFPSRVPSTCLPTARVYLTPAFFFFFLFLFFLFPLILSSPRSFPHRFEIRFDAETEKLFFYFLFFLKLYLLCSLAWRPSNPPDSSIGYAFPMGLTYPFNGYGWRPWPRSPVLLYGRSPGWMVGKGNCTLGGCLESNGSPVWKAPNLVAAAAAFVYSEPIDTKIHIWVDGMHPRFFSFSFAESVWIFTLPQENSWSSPMEKNSYIYILAPPRYINPAKDKKVRFAAKGIPTGDWWSWWLAIYILLLSEIRSGQSFRWMELSPPCSFQKYKGRRWLASNWNRGVGIITSITKIWNEFNW